MNLPPVLRARPSRWMQLAIWLLAISLVALVGLVHLQTGPAYEFHLFFALPVMLVAWFVSRRRGYVIATLAVILWYLADRQLAGETADRLPLLFNTVIRLGLLVAIVRLLDQLRRSLDRTTQGTGDDRPTHPR